MGAFCHIRPFPNIRLQQADRNPVRCTAQTGRGEQFGKSGTEEHLPRDRRTHRRRYLHWGGWPGAQRQIHLYQAFHGTAGAARHRPGGCAGACPGRAAPVGSGPHHHDHGTKIHPGSSRAPAVGGRRRVPGAAHRLRGLHGGGGYGPRGKRQAPHGQKPVVRPRGALRPCRRDRHPQGDLRTFHHRHRGHHRRLCERHPAGGLCQNREAHRGRTGCAGQALHHPAQQHPPGCPGDEAAGRGHGTGLRPHRAAGELRGSGRGGTRQHPAAGSVRVPGAGAGFCPAALGHDVGKWPLAANAGVRCGHAAGGKGLPHEGCTLRNRRTCAGM